MMRINFKSTHIILNSERIKRIKLTKNIVINLIMILFMGEGRQFVECFFREVLLTVAMFRIKCKRSHHVENKIHQICYKNC